MAKNIDPLNFEKMGIHTTPVCGITFGEILSHFDGWEAFLGEYRLLVGQERAIVYSTCIDVLLYFAIVIGGGQRLGDYQRLRWSAEQGSISKDTSLAQSFRNNLYQSNYKTRVEQLIGAHRMDEHTTLRQWYEAVRAQPDVEPDRLLRFAQFLGISSTDSPQGGSAMPATTIEQTLRALIDNKQYQIILTGAQAGVPAGGLAAHVVAFNGAMKAAVPYLNSGYDISQGQFANMPDGGAKESVETVLRWVWDYRVKSLLREYMRGDQKCDDHLRELEAVWFSYGAAPSGGGEDE